MAAASKLRRPHPERRVAEAVLQAKGLLSSPRRLAASRGIDFGDLTEEIGAGRGVVPESLFKQPSGSPVVFRPCSRLPVYLDEL